MARREHEAEHLAVGRGVVEARAGGRLALVELLHCVGAAFGLPEEGVVDQAPALVARAGLGFLERDARGHGEEMADRGLAVGMALEVGHVLRRLVVERCDVAFVDGDADQHAEHGLRYRG